MLAPENFAQAVQFEPSKQRGTPCWGRARKCAMASTYSIGGIYGGERDGQRGDEFIAKELVGPAWRWHRRPGGGRR
jgi:hypothetical protein